MLKYAKSKYAHMQIYHKHKYAQNIHKSAKPEMHKYAKPNMQKYAVSKYA